MKRFRALPALLASLIALTAIGISLLTGAAALPVDRVLAALLGNGTSGEHSIVIDLRLPRALLAALAGGGLAVSGATFQAMLRNPLAEPYILGVSGGAALGAVIVTVFTRSYVALPFAA